MRRLLILLIACGGSMLGTSRASDRPRRPNIVVIIADDMAWDDCGAYGHPKIRTPNIDRLAREGMRFDRAFVTASSCSPSRSSLITGRYPHSTDAEELHWPLPPEQVTFVEKLKASGYWTAAAGKWHLGNAVKDRFDVVREANAAGFQIRMGKDGKPRMTADGPGAVQAGCDQWVPVLRDRPRDRPFFLWLASLDPHRDYQPGTIPQPHRPEDVTVPPYLPEVPEVRKDLALYYDEIGRLDHYVGEVLAELDRQQIAGETLVLFLSDNGRPFPRCKTTLHDSGIRTPLLARWPGKIRPGSRCGRLVSTVDIAPTLLKLGGVAPLPSVQGRDISPMFGDPTVKVRETIFAERNWHDYAAHGRAVRSERFKYIQNDDRERPLTPPADAVRSPTFQAMRRLRDEGKLTPEQKACFLSPRPAEELYDVDADPHELVNLAGDRKYAEELGRMRRALSAWARETGDAVPARLTPDEFDRETGDPLPGRVRPRQNPKVRAARAADATFPKGPPRSPEFFPIAVWLQDPANSGRYRAIGINTYVALWRGPTAGQLDALDRAGIRLVCGQTAASLRFKDRPTIIGWMHGDEPDNAQSLGRGKGYGPPVPPERIVEGYRKIRQADPDRPVMLNLGQGVAWDGWYGRGVRTNHPEDYPKYLEGCDIASFDIYPASHEKPEIAGQLWYVPRGVDRLRRWTGDRKGVWCCIETTRIDNPDRGPTPEQVRSEVWMALIHGARGIIYFVHQFKPRFIEAGLLADEAMARGVAALNRQIHDLAPVLNGPDTPGGVIVTSSAKEVPIDFVVKQHDGRTYVFAVAMREKETTGTFRLPDAGDARVEVLGEGRTIPAVGGRWEDRFAGYQVHLYRIDGGR